MKINGYLMSNNTQRGLNKIINKIKENGIEMYKYYNCIPRYIISFYDDSKEYIYFESKKHNIEYMNLLGFSFEGLVDSDDKINELESFGKYGCEILEINDNFDKNDLIIRDFVF